MVQRPKTTAPPSRPTVSVVTPCLNSAQTIADTIASVRQQTVAAEHIFCDGGSVDGTTDLVRELAPRARINSRPDAGLYDAMNRGIGLCTGEVIGILNADDFYCDPRVLAEVVEVFAARPDVDLVYGCLHYVDARDTRRVTRRWRPGPASRKAWRQGWMPPHPAVFVRASVYREFGAYNLALSMSADYEFLLRTMYFGACEAHYLDRVLVNMRTGGVSNATLGNRLRANREDRRAWDLNDARAPLALGFLKPFRKLNQWRWSRPI